jgi:hypothetical protein
VIFKGIYYHVQIQGVDRDRVAEYRTKLDVSACELRHDHAEDGQSNGATYCGDPSSTRCRVILVDTPTGATKFNYTTRHGAARRFEECQKSGEWSFNALCTHFGRRSSIHPDNLRSRRKKVVGLGWIEDCLSQDKLLIDGRYGLWEVM